ncbi:MAG: AAA family ATPase [Acidimicrobiia bacterium]
MPQAGKTFRVFVSSTFRDLVKERNALQVKAFANLKRRCEAEGVRFQAIDLRWGISQEASLDQQTIPICIAEVKRCQRITPRPNFLVLLGDRYGWRALPTEIPASEWELLWTKVTDSQQQQQHLLAVWYRRDDNAVPPVYVLQPRLEELPEQATEDERERNAAADGEVWAGVESQLREILLNAIEGLDLSPDQLVKYEKSATEQEIHFGALGTSDAHEHVFCFFRSFEDAPSGPTAVDFVDADQDDRDDLAALKAGFEPHLWHDHIVEYTARWGANEVADEHLDELSDRVEEALWTQIRSGLARREQLFEEVMNHREFGDDRAKHFTGRRGVVDALADHARSGGEHPFALSGASGSGKSALIAEVAREVVGRALGAPEEQDLVDPAPGKAPRHADEDGMRVIVRFIGASPESSDVRRLLAGLCQEISRRYGPDESAPADYRELVQELPKRLALATKTRPLVIFLDAVDQLSDAENARSLVWLPRQLPEHVRIIVSTLTDPRECLDALEAKLPESHRLELTEMTVAEGGELLDAWLDDDEVKRTLTDDQRREVLDKFASNGLPLYLKLAFEEARRWHSYDRPSEEERPGTYRPLDPTVTGLIRTNLFGRLRSTHNHGPLMVDRSLAYLRAAKSGMSEEEMLGVLSMDPDDPATVLGDFRSRQDKDAPDVRQLPIVVWSRFYLDLEPYLSTRQSDGAQLLSFYHRQLGEVVAEDYLEGADGVTRHAELARYFGEQEPFVEVPVADGEEPRTVANVRRLVELPFQQTSAEDWDGVFETLTDFEFLEQKATHVGVVDNGDETKTYTGVYQLQDDYTFALERMPGGDGEAGTDKRRRIILTGVDFHDGNDLQIHCPHCNKASPFQQEWRGEDITCPQEGCGGPLRINKFIVGESALEMQWEK